MLKHLIFGLCFVMTAMTALAQTYGIVTGDKVRVRSSASTSGKILMELDAGATVVIQGESANYSYAGTPGNDECAQAKWVKVQLMDGTVGHIYGEFVQKIDMSRSYGKFKSDGVTHNLYLTEPYNLPSLETSDYTIPCGFYYFPVLVPSGSPMGAQLIRNKTTFRANETTGKACEVQSYKDKYWVLTATEAFSQNFGDDGIESYGKFLIDMNTYSVEYGNALSVVELSKDSQGRFIAKGITFQITDN